MVRHVLLVEAGLASREVPWESLRQLGHWLRWVEGTEEIEARIGLGRPEPIVFADPTRCRQLKCDARTHHLPVVAVVESRWPSELRVDPEAELVVPATVADVTSAIEQAREVQGNRLREGILAELSVWLPSSNEELDSFCQLLPEWLTSQGMTTCQVRQTTLAVREIVANSIEWGHGYQRTRLVRVECKADEEKVTILVRDTGPGFDRTNLPHAARPGDLFTHLEVRSARNLREGGFGLLLARGLVDHLCFSETGNEGLLVKFLPHQQQTDLSTEWFSLFAP